MSAVSLSICSRYPGLPKFTPTCKHIHQIYERYATHVTQPAHKHCLTECIVPFKPHHNLMMSISR